VERSIISETVNVSSTVRRLDYRFNFNGFNYDVSLGFRNDKLYVVSADHLNPYFGVWVSGNHVYAEHNKKAIELLYRIFGLGLPIR
jgi:hypothetical protein